MIVTFDDRKNMMSETLRLFKDRKSIPPCSHCGTELSYDSSIKNIFCRGELSNGQKCWDRHGQDYKETFSIDSEEDIKTIKDFSEYCQSLKPFIKHHAWYKLNATLPIKMASSINYNRGTESTYQSLIKFCASTHNDESPYLSDIVNIDYYYPTLSQAEKNIKLFEITKDNVFLPEEVKETFIF